MSTTDDCIAQLEALVDEGVIIKGVQLPREPRKRATFEVWPNDTIHLEYNIPQVDAFVQGVKAAQAAASADAEDKSLHEVDSDDE